MTDVQRFIMWLMSGISVLGAYKALQVGVNYDSMEYLTASIICSCCAILCGTLAMFGHKL